MSVRFRTSTPRQLLANFKKGIASGDDIRTWEDSDRGFTHTDTRQWAKRAYFTTVIEPKVALEFFIQDGDDGTLPPEVRSFYEGHLVQTMLYHFHDQFTDAVVTWNTDRTAERKAG